MSKETSRREFLKAGLAAGAATVIQGRATLGAGLPSAQQAASGGRSPCVVASSNGLRATAKAMSLLRQGVDPLDAVIAGVNLVEDDPGDMSVGFGGLPNEDGVVELDASVMHGATHRAGAVAGLRNIKNPSRVAKLVMERTDHVLLVGEGALRFARAHGFQEENLLTEESRRIWLEWKEKLSDRDKWFPPEEKKKDLSAALLRAVETYGTINCLALDAKRDLAGVTTTSGLAFKIPGRAGDSPIIGAGLYVDNEVGAAGSTGRGEANLTTCASFQVVSAMSRGDSPEEACLKALKYVFEKTKLVPRLLDNEGLPRFGLSFYALNKKGEFGSAAMFSGEAFSVHDGRQNRQRDSAHLFERRGRRPDAP
ncbi:MAG: asparaginase [Candidatus Aminicenantes bacterium RBG_13_63_10]|nr:MAG: asparaginase [Candidatus Aminicenantes bacterium RBG_13_63_10]